MSLQLILIGGVLPVILEILKSNVTLCSGNKLKTHFTVIIYIISSYINKQKADTVATAVALTDYYVPPLRMGLVSSWAVVQRMAGWLSRLSP